MFHDPYSPFLNEQFFNLSIFFRFFMYSYGHKHETVVANILASSLGAIAIYIAILQAAC